ncbi:type IV pilus modification protein PilV [Pseudoalteromonas luteoviolacea]|uniref:Type IV pilus modification protein PilV n=1 Tax=Pseudoalteromonas luteoviolacea TaxID=43657 RepID=A0A1C0TM46_9GAMM|nr:type IV pilus modification protein PilV [Pseudoalteromonas luteoviolacea]MBQ4812299.1 type IV pilus modification protein PilV [Pseudoalteromonas luteoviolacea]OCQ19958.1 type IV pilus modification protein PilV [Pseudoalteromonas luteoviolacea]
MSRLFPKVNQAGFTLLEVVIAFMVLSFGLLGAVALQAKAKQASFDSMQRAAAVALAGDIMQRIRSNDTANLIDHYGGSFTSQTQLANDLTCFSNFCNNLSIANLDKEQWKQAIRAKENTGSLDDTTVCITPVRDGDGFSVTVTVAWVGRQAIKANNNTTAINCGTKDDYRRLVSISSFVLVRS